LDTPQEWIIGQGIFNQAKAPESMYSETPSHGKQPDNWIVLLLTGTGIVGLGVFLFMLFQLMYHLMKAQQILWVGISAILLHGMFNASLTHPFVLIVLGVWTIASYCQKLPVKQQLTLGK
jgi:hypothetical protein